MTKIISVANQKGGVGKTTTTMNIGACLAKKGFNVLLVDLDPQANLTEYLDLSSEKGKTISDLLLAATKGDIPDLETVIKYNDKEKLSVITADLNLSSAEFLLINAMCREKVLDKILRSAYCEKFDYIIIDCLPSLGILLLNALSTSDQLIIPVQAHKFANDGLEGLLGVFNMVKQNLNASLSINGILVSLMDNTNIAAAVEAHLRSRFGDLVYMTTVKRAVEVVNSSYDKVSLSDKSKSGQAFERLSEEVVKRCKDGKTV